MRGQQFCLYSSLCGEIGSNICNSIPRVTPKSWDLHRDSLWAACDFTKIARKSNWFLTYNKCCIDPKYYVYLIFHIYLFFYNIMILSCTGSILYCTSPKSTIFFFLRYLFYKYIWYSIYNYMFYNLIILYCTWLVDLYYIVLVHIFRYKIIKWTILIY